MTRLTSVARWAVLAGTATLAACSSNTPPGLFIIVQNQVPDSTCAIPATLGDVYRSTGTLDVRVAGDYELFPLMQNDFPGPTGGQNVDGNRIAISGFDVDVGLPVNAEAGPIATLIQSLHNLPDDDPAKPLVQYSRLASGSVASGGGNTSSRVVAFPADLATMIRAMGVLSPTKTYWVEATVRARGSSLTGNVRSDAFHYPIELCDGCLTVDLGQCDAMTPTGTSCTPGQDNFVGCCEVSGQLVCR
jgi:hypothetical protein